MIYNLNQMNELLKQYTVNKTDLQKNNFTKEKIKNNTKAQIRNVTIIKY